MSCRWVGSDLRNWKRPGTTVGSIVRGDYVLRTRSHDRIPVIIPPGSYDRRLGMLDPNPLNLLTSFPVTVWLISTKV